MILLFILPFFLGEKQICILYLDFCQFNSWDPVIEIDKKQDELLVFVSTYTLYIYSVDTP